MSEYSLVVIKLSEIELDRRVQVS